MELQSDLLYYEKDNGKFELFGPRSKYEKLLKKFKIRKSSRLNSEHGKEGWTTDSQRLKLLKKHFQSLSSTPPKENANSVKSPEKSKSVKSPEKSNSTKSPIPSPSPPHKSRRNQEKYHRAISESESDDERDREYERRLKSKYKHYTKPPRRYSPDYSQYSYGSRRSKSSSSSSEEDYFPKRDERPYKKRKNDRDEYEKIARKMEKLKKQMKRLR